MCHAILICRRQIVDYGEIVPRQTTASDSPRLTLNANPIVQVGSSRSPGSLHLIVIAALSTSGLEWQLSKDWNPRAPWGLSFRHLATVERWEAVWSFLFCRQQIKRALNPMTSPSEDASSITHASSCAEKSRIRLLCVNANSSSSCLKRFFSLCTIQHAIIRIYGECRWHSSKGLDISTMEPGSLTNHLSAFWRLITSSRGAFHHFSLEISFGRH